MEIQPLSRNQWLTNSRSVDTVLPPNSSQLRRTGQTCVHVVMPNSPEKTNYMQEAPTTTTTIVIITGLSLRSDVEQRGSYSSLGGEM